MGFYSFSAIANSYFAVMMNVESSTNEYDLANEGAMIIMHECNVLASACIAIRNTSWEK